MSVTADTATEAEEQAQKEPLSRSQKMAVARAARAFASYGDAKKAMAKIAKSIVSLRLTFDKDGRPDFRGETPQYRGAIASLYEATIPDEAERNAFKVAIRYWVGKEFAARIDAGDIEAAELEDAGIGLTSNRPASSASTGTREREPRRAATAADLTPTGVMVDGNELTPPEVVVEAERIVEAHVAADEVLGPVMALQHVGRELGPIVAALRDEEVRGKQPGRAILAASEQLLTLSLDAAALSGVEVEEFVASWMSVHAEPVSEVAA